MASRVNFGRVVNITMPIPLMKAGLRCYFLDGWDSAIPEGCLRPLTLKEKGGLK